MDNYLVQRYFSQYQELFGNTVYTNKKIKTSFNVSGNKNSSIVFLKKYPIDKIEIDIFNKILKALNMSNEEVLVIDCLGSNYNSKDKLISFLEKLNLTYIVAFGEEISQYILRTDYKIEEIRKKNNMFNKLKVIATYSIKDIINKLDFKKKLWKDIKVIK